MTRASGSTHASESCAQDHQALDRPVDCDLPATPVDLKHLIVLREECSCRWRRPRRDAAGPGSCKHILGAIVEFERTGSSNAFAPAGAREGAGQAPGRTPHAIADDRFEVVAHLSLREAATALGVSRSVVHRWRLSGKPREIASPDSRELRNDSANRGVTSRWLENTWF